MFHLFRNILYVYEYACPDLIIAKHTLLGFYQNYGSNVLENHRFVGD